jgi:hypothetical protein
VRVEIASVFAHRRVREQLPELRRPVIGGGDRHIDLGAADEADADRTAQRARTFEGVATVSSEAIKGRLRRWWLRQRLSRNYGAGPEGPRYDYPDGGGHHGSDGGGDSGGGGNGG